ncbi:MAG: phosphotransferase [Mycobacteriales bacterium]
MTYDAAEEPEHLAGNVGGAWRIGDTVHRATGPWTPAVHALLDFLAPRLDHIPRVLGFDDEGREVLTYLPGRVLDVATELLTADQLVAVVTWTRTFHAAVAGFAHPGPWRFPEPPHATIVGHNDIAPYNTCFEGERLVGVFDWDIAGPTTPLLELAFLAWNGVPLWQDIGPGPAAERITLIAGTYSGVAARDILDAVPVRIQRMLDGIPAAAAAGDAGMVTLMGHGEPARSQRLLDGLLGRIPAIAALLG